METISQLRFISILRIWLKSHFVAENGKRKQEAAKLQLKNVMGNTYLTPHHVTSNKYMCVYIYNYSRKEFYETCLLRVKVWCSSCCKTGNGDERFGQMAAGIDGRDQQARMRKIVRSDSAAARTRRQRVATESHQHIRVKVAGQVGNLVTNVLQIAFLRSQGRGHFTFLALWLVWKTTSSTTSSQPKSKKRSNFCCLPERIISVFCFFFVDEE